MDLLALPPDATGEDRLALTVVAGSVVIVDPIIKGAAHDLDVRLVTDPVADPRDFEPGPPQGPVGQLGRVLRPGGVGTGGGQADRRQDQPGPQEFSP